jgi:endogenous inhibitor of DNA gyrase (YacG/DUF329 family)
VICPTCRKPVDPRGEHAATMPFCSETCRDIDLVRWLDGKYAIPGDPVESAGLSGEEEEER